MSSTVRTVSFVALGVAVAVLAVILVQRPEPPEPVRLVADDAARGCGAEIVPGRGVVVPPQFHDGPFMPVPAARTPTRIACGDGATYGAVHVETAHEVPNWAEAITAMTSTIDRGRAEPVDGGTRYVWEFAPGRSITVIAAGETVVTAFPSDGQRSSWSEASVA